MKILFNNILSQANLSATNEDANYPVSNLRSTFLRKKFQSTGLTSTVSINFISPVTINAVYYSYTNASAVIIRVYNGVTLLHTFNDVWGNFDTVLVDKVEIDISVASGLAYLGGVGLGEAYILRPPESFWDEGFDDRSIVSESQTGQSLQEYVEPLKVYQFTYSGMERDEARALEAQYVSTGKGKPLYVDFDTDGLEPLYCKITDAISVSKNKRIYTGKISFREAR